MCKFVKKLYTKHLNAEVEKYWAIYHFDMEPGHQAHNNEGDAFKHCFWQAEMTIWFGKTVANWMGVKHEDNNPYNTPGERTMDLHNNQIGQEIGKAIKKVWPIWFTFNYDDEIADKTMDAMRAGKLITKPVA